MNLILLQAPAVRDTVFVVQQTPGWHSWVQLLAGIAQIVLAIALLAVGLGVLFAAIRVKALVRKVEEQGQKLRVDLAPAIRNLTTVTENVNFVSRNVRRDADRLSRSVNSVTETLHQAAEMAQTRVGEFNALIGVVQEEAEAIFIGGASTLRGVQAGADTFRRFQSGDLEYLGEVYVDDEDEFEDEEFDDEDDDFDIERFADEVFGESDDSDDGDLDDDEFDDDDEDALGEIDEARIYADAAAGDEVKPVDDGGAAVSRPPAAERPSAPATAAQPASPRAGRRPRGGAAERQAADPSPPAEPDASPPRRRGRRGPA